MMEISTIKNRLSKHLEHHDSFYLLNHKKSDADYYYNFNNYEEIEKIIKIHQINQTNLSFDNVRINYYKNTKDNLKDVPILITLKQYDSDVHLSFYYVKGIDINKYYHSLNAKLVVENNFLNIKIDTDKDAFYWESKNYQKINDLSFNYHLNKLLYINKQFRNIFVELLTIMGDKYYIFKDLAKDVEESKCCLLPMNINELKKYHNRKELMMGFETYPRSFNYNKHNVNSSYYKSRVYPYLDDKSKDVLARIKDETVLNLIGLEDFYEGMNIRRFAKKYFNNKLSLNNSHESMLVEDYVDMRIDRGEVLNINVNSFRQLERLHDYEIELQLKQKISSDSDTYMIMSNSKFNGLRELLPNQFEWIETSRRLFKEGLNQHNCVYGYKGKIQNDLCAIYHLDIEDRYYTIEFGVNNSGNYIIKQMLQKYNKMYLKQDYNYVNDFLRKGKDNDILSS